MKIIIQLHTGGNSISLRAAVDDDSQEKYKLKTCYGEVLVDAIELLHCDTVCLRSTSREDFYMYSLRTNIELESKVDFKHFCEQLAASPFANPKNWHLRKHNCAMGVLYALRLAGIPIKVPSTIIFNRVGSFSLDLVPGFSLSPLDLFGYITAYKAQQLTNQDIDFKLELASTALRFWNKRNPNQEQRKLIDTINNKVAPYTREHLAQRDCLLNIIHQTADYILQRPYVIEKDGYGSNKYTRSARLFTIKPAMENDTDGVVSCANLTITSGILFGAFKYFGANNKATNIFGLVSLAVIAVSAYKAYHRYQQYWYGPRPYELIPTNLSESIVQLGGRRTAS